LELTAEVMIAGDHIGIDPGDATIGVGVGEKGLGEGHRIRCGWT
jgi:hypothetical protein